MECYSRLLYFYFIKKGGDVKNFSKLKKPCPEAKFLTRRKK